MANDRTGFTGTWEILTFPEENRTGATGTANSGMIRRPASAAERGRNAGRSKVSPSEGNEVRREGRQGVAVPHSSVEAGERALPDPVERRGCRVVDRTSEPRRGHRASPACHRKPTGSCEGQRHNVTNRMHLTGTSGSVGGLGGQPPRSTRPGSRQTKFDTGSRHKV